MNIFLTIIIGFLAGVTGGLFGVGGGLIFVPLLILLKHFDPHLAVGTSLAVIVPTALVAAFRHQMAHMIDWRSVLFLTVFAVLGSWAGAELSLKLDTHLLRRLFAVFLFLLSLKLFFQNTA